MQAKTIQLIQRLSQVRWFENVGKVIADPSVKAVPSWKVATAHCCSNHSENVNIDARNHLSQSFAKSYGEHSDFGEYWNNTVDALKELYTPILVPVVKSEIEQRNLPKRVLHRFEWQLLNACLELELANWVTLSFFQAVIEWYIRGHFPCGMEGEYPSGTLLVY